ncbi:MAG: substrate-binding domain-containing protein, partial [Eubacteriales bacterium]
MQKGFALLLALMLLLGLTGCAGKQETEKEESSIVVGFSQLGAESSWRIANTASMEEAAKEAGYGLMMENANQKQEKQIDAIRSFIAYQVDVIVFSPIVETGWDNVLSEAKQAGIPVI